MNKIDIIQSDEFSQWLHKLKDIVGKARLVRRLERISETGDFGDVKTLDYELTEIRFFFGPGYRIYFTQKGDKLIILLNAGDKSTQSKDIAKARKILKRYDENEQ